MLDQRAEDDVIFIDAGPEVFFGEEARSRLAIRNDSGHHIRGHGIPRVPSDRWEFAQRAETQHWFGLGGKARVTGDDRNLAHYERFKGYDAVKGCSFANALDVGSGPFTNLRLIGWGPAKVGEASLLDPHVGHYLAHPGS